MLVASVTNYICLGHSKVRMLVSKTGHTGSIPVQGANKINKMNRVLVLSTQSGDWEGLFVDGVLISEGHHLGEGKPAEFWIDMSKKYSFESKDITRHEVTDEDDDLLDRWGSFPKNLSELKGKY